ncbi:N-6 DNA methylase [Lyngbya confervoides]|uniref:SAM-dependent methyltransferase n=1 Tax=Lyngbya confervoides BDU141951 TaxID=1574623 RepID=A0ABD4T599_9CYAN|nr:N-6 DNA methylase [Lyngbya confervoides]MCM1983882.1 SAM-dependent methyltransferase [Lyngbya confervoides BDU141951]
MRDAAGDSGEFYTPRPVVKFMVEVTDPYHKTDRFSRTYRARGRPDLSRLTPLWQTRTGLFRQRCFHRSSRTEFHKSRSALPQNDYRRGKSQ